MERPTIYQKYFHIANKESLFPISDVPLEFRQDKVSLDTLKRRCYREIYSFAKGLIAKYGDGSVLDVSDVFEEDQFTGPRSKLCFSNEGLLLFCKDPLSSPSIAEFREYLFEKEARSTLGKDVLCCQLLAKHFGEADTFSRYLEWIKLRIFDKMKTIITENASDGILLDVSDLSFPSLPFHGKAVRMEYLPAGSNEGENIRVVFLGDTDCDGEWSEVFHEYFSDMDDNEMAALCNVIETRYIADCRKRFCRSYPHSLPEREEFESDVYMMDPDWCFLS